jgi:hypothetical protein
MVGVGLDWLTNTPWNMAHVCHRPFGHHALRTDKVHYGR